MELIKITKRDDKYIVDTGTETIPCKYIEDVLHIIQKELEADSAKPKE